MWGAIKRLISRAALRLARGVGLTGLAVLIAAAAFFNIMLDSVFWFMSAVYDGLTMMVVGVAIYLGYKLLTAGQNSDQASLLGENARLRAELAMLQPDAAPVAKFSLRGPRASG